MANKRSNPYLEDFVPQSKVHVGIKQFNNNEDRLKKVYEKTLELLFKGSKKNMIQSDLNEQTASSRVDNMKQLFIGRDGALSQSGKVVTEQHEIKICKCGNAKREQCSYCETPLCDLCHHVCAHCDHFYCVHCSITGSDNGEECVSCYS